MRRAGSWRTYRELKESVDAEALARSRYGIVLDSHGKGRCPRFERHNQGDAHPSFQLYKGRFRCWSQGCFGEEGVDVFGLVQEMEGVSLAEARHVVAAYADGGAPTASPAGPAASNEGQPPA